MTPHLRFFGLVLALLAGPAAAETTVATDPPADCPLTGPVTAMTDGCAAQRVQYRAAVTACLQDRRVKALATHRLGAGHTVSAPAARAQMRICQAEVSEQPMVVE